MREFRTSGSVGAPGERSPGATRRRPEQTPSSARRTLGVPAVHLRLGLPAGENKPSDWLAPDSLRVP